MKHRLAYVVRLICSYIATLGPFGYISDMPGTIGSICAIPIVYGCRYQFVPYIGERWFLLSLIIAATCIVSYALPVFAQSDPDEIIIDEVVGMFVTLYLLPLHPVTLVFGFILFRMFDIVKPLGIGYAENISGSVGIVFDDIVAGIYAHICLTIVLRFF